VLYCLKMIKKPHDKLQGFVVGLDKAPQGAVAISWMIAVSIHAPIRSATANAPAVVCLACVTVLSSS